MRNRYDREFTVLCISTGREYRVEAGHDQPTLGEQCFPPENR